MKLELSLDAKPISWNVLARKSHWTYTKAFKEWQEHVDCAIYSWMAEQKKTRCPTFLFPVTIQYHAEWKGNRRHDICDLMTKAATDRLVAHGILVDDSLPYVKKAIFSGETGCKQDRLLITLSDEK